MVGAEVAPARPWVVEAGERYGRLVTVQKVQSTGRGAVWEALCDCGTRWKGPASRLREGKVRSCGCLRREASRARGMARVGLNKYGEKSLVSAVVEGFTVGRLTVVAHIPQPGVTSDSAQRWLCKCRCGYLKPVRADSLAYRHTKSCGCLAIDRLRRRAAQSERRLEGCRRKFKETVVARQDEWRALYMGPAVG